VNDVMRVELEEADFRRVEAAANRQASAMTESARCAGNDGDARQAVGMSQFVEDITRAARDSALAVARAAGARRAMRAGRGRSDDS
jgi:hypothetical protein